MSPSERAVLGVILAEAYDGICKIKLRDLSRESGVTFKELSSITKRLVFPLSLLTKQRKPYSCEFKLCPPSEHVLQGTTYFHLRKTRRKNRLINRDAVTGKFSASFSDDGVPNESELSSREDAGNTKHLHQHLAKESISDVEYPST